MDRRVLVICIVGVPIDLKRGITDATYQVIRFCFVNISDEKIETSL